MADPASGPQVGPLSGLPLEDLCDAALGRAADAGVRNSEVRIEHIRTQLVSLRDGEVETAVD
ncbi:MAG: hypothetical protein KGJ77_09360, partial [Acidobacteriota bacterium]|nr:hypothetical protein [Acidobacteriota bacterium]